MSGKAAKIIITEKQQAVLQQIVAASTSSVQHTQRAEIILLAFGRMLNMHIAQQVLLTRSQVGKWRRRWQQSFDALVAIECRETNAELTRMIKEVLSDAPRSGCAGKFTAEQVTQILAVACEPPESSDRPIEHWTHRELTDEVIKRGIVPSISMSRVGSFLKDADLQPHRFHWWKTTIWNDEAVERALKILWYYERIESLWQRGEVVLAVDEKPNIQVLERALAQQRRIDAKRAGKKLNLSPDLLYEPKIQPRALISDEHPAVEKIDFLLEKIGREGINSLTESI